MNYPSHFVLVSVQEQTPEMLDSENANSFIEGKLLINL